MSLSKFKEMFQITTNIDSGSFITLEMKSQVKHTALWDTVLHILAHVIRDSIYIESHIQYILQK